jgi:N6-L-threonylcarbamoyladenine synthase
VALQDQVPLVVPPPSLCTDNGAIIAWAGAERLAHRLWDTLDTAPRARWPLDQVAKPAPLPPPQAAWGRDDKAADAAADTDASDPQRHEATADAPEREASAVEAPVTPDAPPEPAPADPAPSATA